MDIRSIDRSATGDLGWLHRVSPVSKLIAFALVIAAIVTSWNILVVLGIALTVLGVAASTGLNLKTTLTLAAYPALFAVVFAFASAPDPFYGATIVLKAVGSGLCAVTLVLTTPYPQVFSPIQRIVPTIVGDALLMTYRSTFLLLGKFSSVLRAVRLRAGLRGTHPVLAGRATTQALGGLLLYSFDLASRDYDILRLRGYSGHLKTTLPKSRDVRFDWVLLACAVALLVMAVAWRVAYAELNQFSWLVTVGGAMLLCSGFAVRWRKR